MASLASAGMLTRAKKGTSQASSPAASMTNGAPSTASIDNASTVAKNDPVQAFQKLEKKMKAINTNSVARVANSHIASDTDKLQPLVSLKNGRVIDNFPPTAKDIGKLTSAKMDVVLTHMEADRSGSEKQRRERLRMQIGLKPTAA